MSHKNNRNYLYLILRLPHFKKLIYLRVVYICMNDVDKKEDYSDYAEYMYIFIDNMTMMLVSRCYKIICVHKARN